MTKNISWKAAFLTLLGLNLLVVGRDIVPRLEDRIARERAAANLSDEDYFRAVRKVAVRWLPNPPRVKLHDKRSLLILEDLREWRGNKLSLSWPSALLAKGVALAHRLHPEPGDVRALRAYFDKWIRPDGKLAKPFSKVDQYLNAEPLIDLEQETGDPRYHRALDRMAEDLLERSVKEGGTLAYRPGTPEKDFRYVDALGEICPFLSRYGAVYRKPEATALAVRQLKDFIAYGVDPKTGLPYHAYNPKEKTFVGEMGWGRGAGWYAMGLVDTIRWLRPEDPERRELGAEAARLARRLRFYQREDGGWGGLLNAPSPYDSSATSMLAYFLKRSVLEGIIDESYETTVDAAVRSLKKHTRSDGTVDDAQGSRKGIGSLSGLYGPAPYAQGTTLALMALVIDQEHY